MSLLAWRRRKLAPALAGRLRDWRARAEFNRARPAARGRWVVVDVETSGLDAERDALICIGAVAVNDAAVDIADSFEVVLRQAAASERSNIELHGLGAGEQLAGEPPEEALAAFLEFIGKDPLVAYHARFDARMLQRALDTHLGLGFRRPWLDLADLAPLAWPGRVSGREGLDGWLAAFGIPMAMRHRAVVDCLATAQLLVAVQHEAGRLGAPTAGRLLRLSGQGRWL